MGISMKELKKNRLTPAEKWVLERFDGVDQKTNPDGIVYWYNEDSEWLLAKDFECNNLNINYYDIASVLEKEFGLNDNEIQELLANLLYDYTDNGRLKIVFYQSFITILTKNIKIIFKKTLKNNFFNYLYM